MKRIIILLTLLPLASIAQQHEISIFGGFSNNYDNVTFRNFVSYDGGMPSNNLLYQGGLTYAYFFGEQNKLGLSSGVNFARKGAKYSSMYKSESLNGKEIDTHFELPANFLSIPLTLEYRPLKFLAFEGGGEYGFNLSESKEAVYQRKNDFSLLAGIKLMSNSMYLNIRYNYGLKSVFTHPVNTIETLSIIDEVKNKSLQVSLGVWLFRNKK